jgi:hypothetical protein
VTDDKNRDKPKRKRRGFGTPIGTSAGVKNPNDKEKQARCR